MIINLKGLRNTIPKRSSTTNNLSGTTNKEETKITTKMPER